MIRADLLDGIFTSIWEKVTDAFLTLGDYFFIGELWVAVVALFIATGFVAMYVPWQWVRSALGFVAISAGIFAAGAQVMFNRMRGETAASRERARLAEQKKADDERHGSWF